MLAIRTITSGDAGRVCKFALPAMLAITLGGCLAGGTTTTPMRSRPAAIITLSITSDPPGAEIWSVPSPRVEQRSDYHGCVSDATKRVLVGKTPYTGTAQLFVATHGADFAVRAADDSDTLMHFDWTQKLRPLWAGSTMHWRQRFVLKKAGYQDMHVQKTSHTIKASSGGISTWSYAIANMAKALNATPVISHTFTLAASDGHAGRGKTRSAGSRQKDDIVRRLKELKELRDTEVLSAEEYERIRKPLVDQL